MKKASKKATKYIPKSTPPNVVNEPYPVYAIAASPNEGILYWLGGYSIIKKRIKNTFDLLAISSEGITKASLEQLTKHLGISKKNMAEDILDISVKTLERKELTDKLDKRISAHSIELARLMQHAYEVFQNEDKVRQWLARENRALNGSAPVTLLNTLTGINMVNDVLIRIEEGVYS